MKCINVQTESPSVQFDSIKFYGAVINAWAHLYPEELDELIATIKEGKVRFSSPLPYIDGELYLPSPMVSFRHSRKFIETRKNKYHKRGFLKRLKKAKYLPAKYIGEFEDAVFPASLMERIYSEVEDSVSPNVEVPDIRPHVQINRVDGSSTIYFIEEQVNHLLEDRSGARPIPLKILYQGGDDKLIDAALRFIEDRGISKKLSWGLGKVSFSRGTVSDNLLPHIGDYHYLISKYIPGEEETKHIDPTASRMDLDYLSGFRRDGKPIPEAYYIKEGSLLKSSMKLTGRVIDEGDWTLSGIGFFLGDAYED